MTAMGWFGDRPLLDHFEEKQTANSVPKLLDAADVVLL